MSPKPLNIFFFAVDGQGHLNACVGMARALAKRGHRIHFLLNEAFKGQFVAKYGFEEILLSKSAPKDPTPVQPLKNPIQQMARDLINKGVLSAKSPLEKLKSQPTASPFLKAAYETVVEYTPQIANAISAQKPDLIILDHFFIPPIVDQCGIPWIYLFSANPMTLYNSDKLPPFGAGNIRLKLYPTK